MQQGLTVCVSRLIEVATIVGLFLAFWWIGLVLLFGDFTPRRLRAVEVVQLVGQNWAAIMLVTLLLFGRAVRMFLERLKSAFGVEAVHPADDQPEPTQNPKTKDGGLQ